MANFKFIGVEDCGQTCCPHCGAEGRYIYKWEQDGKEYAAMAGCYKALTGRLEKGEDARYWELLAEKQAKGKPLNGFDKSIIRLLEYRDSFKYPAAWCEQKIRETLSQRKAYIAKKW